MIKYLRNGFASLATTGLLLVACTEDIEPGLDGGIGGSVSVGGAVNASGGRATSGGSATGGTAIGGRATGGTATGGRATGGTPSATVPAAPSGLTVTNITQTSATLSWKDNSSNETGFEIGRCTGLASVDSNGNQACVSGFSVTATVPANTTSYSLSGLAAATGYGFYVRAYNGAGSSAAPLKDFTTAAAQTTVTLYPQYDNVVVLTNADSTSANTVYSTGALNTGCLWNYSSFTGIQLYSCYWSFLQFSLGTMSGKTIVSATLRLSVRETALNPAVYFIAAVSGAWSGSTLTANNAPNYYTTAAYAGTFQSPSSLTTYDLNVTSIVQAWAGGTIANYGLTLGPNDVTFPYATLFSAASFDSSDTYAGTSTRPQLIVTYR